MAFQIGLLFLLKHKITLFYLLSFVFIRFMTRCHSLSLIVIFCYSMSFLVTCFTTRCHSLYHPLSFVVPLDTTLCTTPCHLLYYSLSFDATRCTTRLSFYKRSLFYNFLLFTSFIIKAKTKKYLKFNVEATSKLNSRIAFSLAIIWGRGPTRWGPRVKEQKHPML